MSLYVQHGYGKGSKIERGLEEKLLSGVVLSPKSEKPEKIQEFVSHLHNQYPKIDVIFDPQFYIGAFSGELSEGKLGQYPYYMSGITRAKLSNPRNLQEYALNVIKYQEHIGVQKEISPTILFDDFNGKQSQIAVSLAYESLALVKNPEKLLVSLCINENAFRNSEAMNEFLDIASLMDVKGFYIIVDRGNGNIKESAMDSNILSNLMYFCHVLSVINEYEVIIGYTDLLSIPLTAAGATATACGWYNGLKMFAEGNFHPSTGGRRPRKRYTSNKLLNSILLLPEMSTIKNLGKLDSILSNTQYDSLIVSSIDDVEWTDEISCLNNWEALKQVIDILEKSKSIEAKLDYVTDKILQANQLYRIFNRHVPFESKSGSNHLGMWLTAINDFRNKIGV